MEKKLILGQLKMDLEISIKRLIVKLGKNNKIRRSKKQSLIHITMTKGTLIGKTNNIESKVDPIKTKNLKKESLSLRSWRNCSSVASLL